MGVMADTRRWFVDQVKTDEHINGTPKEKIRNLDAAVVNLTPGERKKQLEHVKAYADYYYQGHQRERVPNEVREQIRGMERQVERLNTVDTARQMLERMGGPPTKDTVADAVHRSIKQRELEAGRTPERTPERQQEVAYGHSAGA